MIISPLLAGLTKNVVRKILGNSSSINLLKYEPTPEPLPPAKLYIKMIFLMEVSKES
jgi:hypothetical protein